MFLIGRYTVRSGTVPALFRMSLNSIVPPPSTVTYPLSAFDGGRIGVVGLVVECPGLAVQTPLDGRPDETVAERRVRSPASGEAAASSSPGGTRFEDLGDQAARHAVLRGSAPIRRRRRRPRCRSACRRARRPPPRHRIPTTCRRPRPSELLQQHLGGVVVARRLHLARSTSGNGADSIDGDRCRRRPARCPRTRRR